MVMLASPKRITLDLPLAQARTTLFFPPLMSRLGLLQGRLRGFMDQMALNRKETGF
jgi:hypothetical protein